MFCFLVTLPEGKEEGELTISTEVPHELDSSSVSIQYVHKRLIEYWALVHESLLFHFI